ncbi:MAG: tetratricopeptide repeat protein [Elusimicrobia bacterium]|nr:tetratricopeptide repeat protein [Elusimicrobiota bacterium]
MRLLLVLLLAGTALQARAQPALESAIEAEKAGDWTKAIGLLEPLVSSDPGNLDAAARLAKLYSWSKRYPESEALYRRILAARPDHGDAASGLADVLSWSRPREENAELLRSPVAPPKVELAYGSERYNRMGPGYSWRMDAVVPVRRGWSFLAGAERLRRFHNTDQSQSLGAAWRGPTHGGYMRLSVAPRAAVLPRWNWEGSWGRSLIPGLHAEGSARVSEYAPTHVYTQSAALYFWPRPYAELGARLSATTTQFRGGAALLRWGYLLSSNLHARGETFRFSPSFGRYEEPFEAGSGSLNSFTASVYHLGLGMKPFDSLELKLDGEYEDRSGGTFVRRLQVSTAYRF